MKYLVVSLVFIGCTEDFQKQKEPMDYSCTVAQMKIVDEQTKNCDQNTSYYSTYCYISAMDRNCKKKVATP